MVKKDYFKFYIGAAVLVFLFMMIIAGGIAYYQFEPFITALNYTFEDLSRLQIHIGYSDLYKNYYLRAMFIYMIVIVAFAVNEEKYRRDAAGVEAGSAKWNDDLKGFSKKYSAPIGSASNDSFDNMILSEHVRMSIDDMLTHHNNNVLVVGPAGKGKSRYFIKPNILQANCSYMVTDPSGELLDTLGKEMRDLGYSVKVFNLINMGYSNQYNPFYYINEAKDVGVVVDCFLRNTTPPEESSSDPFWEKSETALLTAIIFYLKDFAGEENRNFRSVLQLVQYMQLEENAIKEQETKLDKLFNGKAIIVNGEFHTVTNKDEQAERKKKLEGSLAWENYMTFKLGAAKTLKSVLMSAAVRLNPFLVPEISNLTTVDTLEMDKIGDEKTIVFVIIPQSNNTYNFLASMLFAQTFEALYYNAGKRNEGSSDEKKLRYAYHIRFLMDEYANIGNIPAFPNKISTMRKYNMSATVVLQSISQIKQMHKDDYETIISNCDTNILLGANDITTAEYYTKLMGKGTIRARSVGYTNGKKKGSSMNYQQSGRELMMIDEIRGMPFEKCVVLVSGEDPIFDDKYDLKNHPRYGDAGDAQQTRRFNLMNSNEYLNMNSIVYDRIDVEPQEQPEAAEVISKPSSIDEIDITTGSEKDDAETKFFAIKDVDRSEAIHYLIRMKTLFDKAVAEERRNKPNVVCIFVGIADPRLVPSFANKYYNEGHKPVLIFCNEIVNKNYIRGYFRDEDGMVANILRDNGHKTIEQLDELEMYCVKRVTLGDFPSIRDSMRIGKSIQDEFGEETAAEIFDALGL